MSDAPASAAAAVQELLAVLLCSAVCCHEANAFGVMRKEELVLVVTLAGETCEGDNEISLM